MQATAQDARRFLVARHFLSPARSLKGGKKAVLKVLSKLGSIQFDPIAVAGRNHDLVLHARVKDYEPAWCEQLYGDKLFEAYNKGLSLVPVEEFPWFRGGWSEQGQQVIDENADVARRVLDRIVAEGPLSSLDFEREQGPTTDWFGIPTNTVRAVLEAYAVTNVLGLARRDGTRRYYDLLERLLPAEIVAQEIPLHEKLRHKMLSRYRAHGLLGASGGGDIFNGLGPAKPDPRRPAYPGRTPLREELVESGEIVLVTVEGVGKRFVLREEVADLESPPPGPVPPSVAFIPPFDPLVWDRKLLGSLFGFDYVWELFIPPAKRRWGWYVLPMLYRDRFVGRIEPRINREQSTVEILDLWWEDGFAPAKTEGFVEAMRDALRAYLRFAGATALEWPKHLTREKRLWPERLA
jgi:uncharacterized protein